MTSSNWLFFTGGPCCMPHHQSRFKVWVQPLGPWRGATLGTSEGCRGVGLGLGTSKGGNPWDSPDLGGWFRTSSEGSKNPRDPWDLGGGQPLGPSGPWRGRVYFEAIASGLCSKLFLLLFEEQDCEVHPHGQVHLLKKDQEWDGILWVLEYGLVVPSCMGTFNIHSLAQLSPK
jgi:hypothetical protein